MSFQPLPPIYWCNSSSTPLHCLFCFCSSGPAFFLCLPEPLPDYWIHNYSPAPVWLSLPFLTDLLVLTLVCFSNINIWEAKERPKNFSILLKTKFLRMIDRLSKLLSIIHFLSIDQLLQLKMKVRRNLGVKLNSKPPANVRLFKAMVSLKPLSAVFPFSPLLQWT